MNYQTHAARIAANTIMSELSMFANVFTYVEPVEDGTVLARSKSATVYHLKWCVTHQRIERIDVLTLEQPLMELVA